MDPLRRNNQISEQEVSLFRQEEINEIKSKVNESSIPTIHRFSIKWSLSLIVAFSFVVILSIFLFTQDDYSLDVQQQSHVEYVVHSNYEGKYQFYLYYKSHVVYKNPIAQYDNTFGYRQPYRYASVEIQEAIPIDFNIFLLNMYTYLLEIEVDGETRYMEIDYYPSFGQIQFLDELEITSFQQDILDIYAWIEQYPPIVTIGSSFSQNVYVHNPSVDSLPDTVQKHNYIQYVDNYYRNGSDDSDKYSTYGDIIPTFVVNNLVVLDEYDDISENTYHVELTNNQLAESEQYNLIKNQFQFYTMDDLLPFGSMTTYYVNTLSQALILQRSGILDGKRYVYYIMSIDQFTSDLTDIDRVEIHYTLHGIYGSLEGTLESYPFYDDGKLIIPPQYVVDETDPMVASLFDQITFQFYDFENQLVYEISFPQSIAG